CKHGRPRSAICHAYTANGCPTTSSSHPVNANSCVQRTSWTTTQASPTYSMAKSSVDSCSSSLETRCSSSRTKSITSKPAATVSKLTSTLLLTITSVSSNTPPRTSRWTPRQSPTAVWKSCQGATEWTSNLWRAVASARSGRQHSVGPLSSCRAVTYSSLGAIWLTGPRRMGLRSRGLVCTLRTIWYLMARICGRDT
ncbi:hypothetical protein LTR48_008925, partial [Friedmanniomyces endolithicus]